jgi:GDPmannose 4,6-dehydratase
LSRALVTGLTGQDGSFLAELLLEKGYEVTGVRRSHSSAALGEQCADDSLGSSEHLRARVGTVDADLLDAASLRRAIEETGAQEIYHLAAPSFVPSTWQHPEQTMRAIVGSTASLLEALRDLAPGPRLFVAASSSMFGEAPESPQREDTPCRPTNPYAVAKLASYQLVRAMRSHYGLYACSAIMFNHESERRPEWFVTRKISRGAAEIYLGKRTELMVGDLDAVRDWSFAGDVVRGAWMMLQREGADDYVLASGKPHTVAELAQTAFACVDLDAERYLRVDATLVRQPEGTPNVGDASKAREELGWEPEVSFEQLVERMVQADLAALRETPGAS